MSHAGQGLVATRVVYEEVIGPIPSGHLIRHKCDNPPCVRPDHLVAGTHVENAEDMLDRGRHIPPRGEKNGQAKLTEEDVRRIRQICAKKEMTQTEVATLFGVSTAAITSIVRRYR